VRTVFKSKEFNAGHAQQFLHTIATSLEAALVSPILVLESPHPAAYY
jgi:hypothetical protein